MSKVKKSRTSITYTSNVMTQVRQKVEVSSVYDEEWRSNLVNIYVANQYPAQSGRSTIGEELTLCLTTKQDVEKFINSVRKATKHIK